MHLMHLLLHTGYSVITGYPRPGSNRFTVPQSHIMKHSHREYNVSHEGKGGVGSGEGWKGGVGCGFERGERENATSARLKTSFWKRSFSSFFLSFGSSSAADRRLNNCRQEFVWPEGMALR